MFAVQLILCGLVQQYQYTPSVTFSSPDVADYIANSTSSVASQHFGHSVLFNQLTAHYSGTNPSDDKKQCVSVTCVSRNKYILTMCLLACGDIHPCPGPVGKRTPRHPCIYCARGVIKTSHAVTCEGCASKAHVRCTDIKLSDYNKLLESQTTVNF